MSTQLDEHRPGAGTARTEASLRSRLLRERRRQLELASPPEWDHELAIEDRDMARAVSVRAKASVEAVDAALERLDDGTYGVCEACAGPIAYQRLLVVPTATLCITCETARGARR